MKFKYKHIDKAEWHEAFAWLPTKVSDNYPEQNTVVWGEKVMRKQSWDGKTWDSYTKKVYFKKKLNGDFDKSEGIMRAEDSVSSGSVGSSPALSFKADSDTGFIQK